MENLWWGYLHQQGTWHVKRFFSKEDISEAVQSPFVVSVYGPWPCATREQAVAKLKEEVESRKGAL